MSEQADNGLWKALGDATRRALLDRLRDGPKTTGALVAEFDMSRFGVMKHLKQLEEAGLVLVRREGRQRFNHLNAVPIERIAQRWVGRFAQPSAENLLALEQHLTQESNMTDQPNLSFHIEQSINLSAPPQRVWKALTGEIGSWWGHRVGPADSDISLDARIGGQFIERWGDGEGELYATITYLRKGEKITLEGGMAMSGPGYSKFSYTLVPTDDGTEVRLTHYCHGVRDPDVQSRFEAGWQELLQKNLVAWVHEGVRA